MMRLHILLPTRVFLDQPVRKIVADGKHGSFGLLPRHVDMVAVLEPGLLLYETPEGEERIIAVAGGTLVKKGPLVRVSTRRAASDAELGGLHQSVIKEFKQLDDVEKQARSAVAKLEADFVRRFIELEGRGVG
jgi:F-type H+-transporting ATPase subunit epsilon